MLRATTQRLKHASIGMAYRFRPSQHASDLSSGSRSSFFSTASSVLHDYEDGIEDTDHGIHSSSSSNNNNNNESNPHRHTGLDRWLRFCNGGHKTRNRRDATGPRLFAFHGSPAGGPFTHCFGKLGLRHDTIRYDTTRYDTIRYDTIRYDDIRCRNFRGYHEASRRPDHFGGRI